MKIQKKANSLLFFILGLLLIEKKGAIMKNYYYEVLYFIFALISRVNPVLGLKITAQRLEVLRTLVENFSFSLEKALETIENMVLKVELRDKVLNENGKGSLAQYVYYKHVRELQFLESILELWFQKFLNLDFNGYNKIERILLIVLGILKYYLEYKDYHFPEKKNLPYNLKGAKSLILEIDKVVDEKKEQFSLEFLDEFNKIRQTLSDLYVKAYIENDKVLEMKKKIKEIIEEG